VPVSAPASRRAPTARRAASRAPVRAGKGAAAARRPRGEVRSLTDEAYAQLEEQIVTMQLSPGSAVSEAMLSERLGIGRTPIREALQRLARERLVRILPRRGVIVSEIDVKSQLRLLEVRREIERLMARAAARRSSAHERSQFTSLARAFRRSARARDDVSFLRTDREFNELCLLAARNEFAATAMGLMNSLSRRFWFLHFRQAADLPVTARLHADLAQAIADGDEALAAAAVDSLLDNIESFTRNTVSTDF
jgi:DNA-binding GntR family transcriptional regulator